MCCSCQAYTRTENTYLFEANQTRISDVASPLIMDVPLSSLMLLAHRITTSPLQEYMTVPILENTFQITMI